MEIIVFSKSLDKTGFLDTPRASDLKRWNTSQSIYFVACICRSVASGIEASLGWKLRACAKSF
jgi:hypothetical protein